MDGSNSLSMLCSCLLMAVSKRWDCISCQILSPYLGFSISVEYIKEQCCWIPTLLLAQLQPRVTHVQAQVFRPLPNGLVSRGRGVCQLILENVITARGIPVLIEHHWCPSTACRKGRFASRMLIMSTSTQTCRPPHCPAAASLGSNL